MGQGYTRNDTGNNISDGNVINASDLDGEFDAIVSAFDSSSGHTHDGTAAEGAPITKFGPSQEVEGDASALFPAGDGVTDLGKSTKEWKDLYIDGVINTDDMSADAATITGNTSVGGTFNVGGATTLTGAASLSNTLAVSATSAFKGAVSVETTLAVTGETNVSDISASGTLDVGGNGSVGGTLVVTGDTDITNVSANGTLDVSGNASVGGTFAVTGDTDVTNVSANGTLDVSGNASVGGTHKVTGNLTADGDIVNTSGNLTIDPATQIVEIKGNGSDTEGQVQLNCHANTHGQIIKAQPHSEAVTNTMLLPKGSNSTLVSEIATQTLTNKTLTSPTINGATIDSAVSVSAAGAVNVGTTLAVIGDTDVSNLSASGTFDVGGNASVGGTLAVTGDTDVANLSASGTFDVGGNGSVGGTFTVTNTITGGSTVSDSKGDLRTVPKAAIYADDYTLGASNAGKYIVLNSSGVSLTIPATTFGEGDVITVLSTDGATASISSNITSFIAGGVSATATMTLEANGVANILFTSASFAILTGNIS